ncbi:hypothetical protein Gpo141_00014307, partial [Globisporangium polare]
ESPNEEFPFAGYEAVSFTSLMTTHVQMVAREVSPFRSPAASSITTAISNRAPALDPELQHFLDCLF